MSARHITEKAIGTAVTERASETKSIKNDILHRMSFLNRYANGVSATDSTSPTIAVGTDTSRTCGAESDTHAQINAITFNIIVATARHSVIIGIIFFTTI